MASEIQLERVSILDFSSNQLAAIANVCFEEYVYPVSLTGAQFDQRFRPESLDSEASFVYSVNGQTAAIVLIARRGWTSHLSTFGVAKAFRGLGIGRRILGLTIEESRVRGDRSMILEVIESNAPAMKLYQAAGFTTIRQLIGYDRPAVPGSFAKIMNIDPRELCRHLSVHGEPNPPWFVHHETLVTKSSPNRAVTLDHKAYALFSEASTECYFWSFFVKADYRRQGYGRALMDAIQCELPTKSFRFVSTFPSEIGGEFMQSLGFIANPVRQCEMELSLIDGPREYPLGE